MPKQYMVGTVDDEPLLIVTVNGKTYFYDEKDDIVYADEPKLPEVRNEAIIASVKEAAQ